VHVGTKINQLGFGQGRSKVKVTGQRLTELNAMCQVSHFRVGKNHDFFLFKSFFWFFKIFISCQVFT